MTMPTLVTLCQAVQNVVDGISGIRVAPDIPAEQAAGSGVTAYCYPGTGEYALLTAGREQVTHILHLIILTPRAHLRSDWARVIGLGDAVQRALLTDSTLLATGQMIDSIRYTFGALEWGGQSEFGWLFELELHNTGSLS
jgi:uncharacterized protein YbjT (DUF2867 family)